MNVHRALPSLVPRARGDLFESAADCGQLGPSVETRGDDLPPPSWEVGPGALERSRANNHSPSHNYIQLPLQVQLYITTTPTTTTSTGGGRSLHPGISSGVVSNLPFMQMEKVLEIPSTTLHFIGLF